MPNSLAPTSLGGTRHRVLWVGGQKPYGFGSLDLEREVEIAAALQRLRRGGVDLVLVEASFAAAWIEAMATVHNPPPSVVVTAQRPLAHGASALHDIKNLLTVLRLRGELLLEDLPSCSEARDETRELCAVADQVIDQVRRLLLGTPEVCAPANLTCVLEEVLAFLLDLLPDGVDLQVEDGFAAGSEVGPVLVPMSKDALAGVLFELVSNALKAMDGSGRLMIRWGHRSGTGSPGVFVEVEDDGTGFPAELGEAMFFDGVSSRSQGTGVGLAAARSRIRFAGGEVTLSPSTLRGTVARIELPVTPGPRTDRASAVTISPCNAIQHQAAANDPI